MKQLERRKCTMRIEDELLRDLEEYMPKLQKELPQLMSGFTTLQNATFRDGVLSLQVKELIALAISISIPCDVCIAHHLDNALKAGATKEQIMEALGVAIEMRGGPAVGEGACKILKKLMEAK
jgi:AhpD family alkylhydroperoxidase